MLEILIGILCTGALTELIRHDKRLTEFRIKLETINGGWFQRFLKDVVGCGWCLSHWSALFTTFVLIAPHILFPTITILWFPYLIAFSLAVTRGANVINDVFKDRCLTPKAPERSNGTD